MNVLSTKKNTASLHDARLEAVSVRPGGWIRFALSHLEVYVPREGRTFSVISHRAVLECHGARRLRVDGEVDIDGWITDGAFPGGSVTVEFGDAQAVELREGMLQLRFNNGTVAQVVGKRFALTLVGEGRFQEEFRE